MATAKTAPARVDSTIGKNITASVQNDILTITVDLSKRLGPSASGKTIIVATSGGNQKIEGTDVTAGLNFYVRP